MIYSALTLALIVAFFYSFILEKERHLFRPEDPDGRRCGYDDAVEYPYIYFVSPVASSLRRAVCVRECPVTGEETLDCLPNSLVPSCEAAETGDPTTSFSVYPTQSRKSVTQPIGS